MTSLQQARLTAEDIKAARELVEKATRGPWFVQEQRHYADPTRSRLNVMYTATDAHNLGAKFSLARVELFGSGNGNDEGNAAFIAAARTLVPALLDEVERLTKHCADLAGDIAALESGRMWHEAATERERIRSLLAEACDHLETEGLDETAARLRQQGGAFER